eukprot:s1718_g10.t1
MTSRPALEEFERHLLELVRKPTEAHCQGRFEAAPFAEAVCWPRSSVQLSSLEKPMGEIPTEGLFLKVFVAWIILAVIFYIWSYVRDGKFIGEEDDNEEEEEDVTAQDVDKVIDQILKELQPKKSD